MATFLLLVWPPAVCVNVYQGGGLTVPVVLVFPLLVLLVMLRYMYVLSWFHTALLCLCLFFLLQTYRENMRVVLASGVQLAEHLTSFFNPPASPLQRELSLRFQEAQRSLERTWLTSLEPAFMARAVAPARSRADDIPEVRDVIKRRAASLADVHRRARKVRSLARKDSSRLRDNERKLTQARHNYALFHDDVMQRFANVERNYGAFVVPTLRATVRLSAEMAAVTAEVLGGVDALVSAPAPPRVRSRDMSPALPERRRSGHRSRGAGRSRPGTGGGGAGGGGSDSGVGAAASGGLRNFDESSETWDDAYDFGDDDGLVSGNGLASGGGGAASGGGVGGGGGGPYSAANTTLPSTLSPSPTATTAPGLGERGRDNRRSSSNASSVLAAAAAAFGSGPGFGGGRPYAGGSTGGAGGAGTGGAGTGGAGGVGRGGGGSSGPGGSLGAGGYARLRRAVSSAAGDGDDTSTVDILVPSVASDGSASTGMGGLGGGLASGGAGGPTVSPSLPPVLPSPGTSGGGGWPSPHSPNRPARAADGARPGGGGGGGGGTFGPGSGSGRGGGGGGGGIATTASAAAGAALTTPAADAPPLEVLARVCAMYDFTSGEENELSLAEGDVVEVLNRHPSGWWTGKCRRRLGCFPSNYTRALSDEEEVAFLEEAAARRAERRAKRTASSSAIGGAPPDPGGGATPDAAAGDGGG